MMYHPVLAGIGKMYFIYISYIFQSEMRFSYEQTNKKRCNELWSKEIKFRTDVSNDDFEKLNLELFLLFENELLSNLELKLELKELRRFFFFWKTKANLDD